jgi:hypothetical protein
MASKPERTELTPDIKENTAVESLKEKTDGSDNSNTGEKPLSEENLANIEKWGVKNPKGRAASVFSLVLWSLFLVMLILKGDWSIGPILLAVLFVLLLLLTGVRLIQEWKENGDWLDDFQN